MGGEQSAERKDKINISLNGTNVIGIYASVENEDWADRLLRIHNEPIGIKDCVDYSLPNTLIVKGINYDHDQSKYGFSLSKEGKIYRYDYYLFFHYSRYKEINKINNKPGLRIFSENDALAFENPDIGENFEFYFHNGRGWEKAGDETLLYIDSKISSLELFPSLEMFVKERWITIHDEVEIVAKIVHSFDKILDILKNTRLDRRTPGNPRTFGAFFSYHVIENSESKITFKTLYGAYESFCDENGYSKISETIFGGFMKRLPLKIESKSRKISYVGIKLV